LYVKEIRVRRSAWWGEKPKQIARMGMKHYCVWEKGKTGRDVQRARNGTWDIMREKEASEPEKPVRRLGTMYGTRDIIREERKRKRSLWGGWRRATEPEIEWEKNESETKEAGDEQRNLGYD
jgi:hypothetical protein